MRGKKYSLEIKAHSDEAEVVAVAESIDIKRNSAKESLGLSDSQIYHDWREIAAQPKMADFAIIALQDNDHYEATLEFIDKGYDILIEKTMAPTAKECKDITEAAEKKGVRVIVCHVLRFTNFYCMVKDIIDDGILGEVISMECKECVGNVH